jgi:hypothetical protein
LKERGKNVFCIVEIGIKRIKGMKKKSIISERNKKEGR